MRSGAAEALGRIGDARAVESLIKALNDADGDCSTQRRRSPRRIGEPAVESLIKALGATSEQIRRTAADALGRIGEPGR